MNKPISYTDEQRRQLDFLCRQAKALEATVKELPPDSKNYSQYSDSPSPFSFVMNIYFGSPRSASHLFDGIAAPDISCVAGI